MRTRLSFAPFFSGQVLPVLAATTLISACQSTDPTPSAQVTAAATQATVAPLFTENVASLPVSRPDGAPVLALTANVTEPTAQEGDPTSQESAQMVEVRMQRQRVLSKEFSDRGAESLSRSDLKKAIVLFSEALELDPANQAARDGFRSTQALLGDPLATGAVQFSTDATDLMVKRAMIRMRAEDFVAKGDVALRDADYDSAVLNYQQAKTILEFNPLIAQDSLDERKVNGLLDEALQLRTESDAREVERKRAEAKDAIARREEATRNQLENKLRNYYDNADRAFRAERYDEAARLSSLILTRDPGNELAQKMLDVARDAGHAKTSEAIRRDYREEWLRTFDDLRTGDVPQLDYLTFDLDRWREVEKRESLSKLQINTASDPVTDEVIKTLRRISVPVNFEDVELGSVADFLSAQSKINFQLSNAARNDIEDTVTLELDERSVFLVLETLAGTIENLAWKVEDGVVLFITSDERLGGQVNATYSVADLVTPIQDFVAPDINVEPSQGLTPPDEDLPERNANVVEASQLEELIQKAVAPNSWEDDPNNSVRVTERGQMVVRQTPEVQLQIVQLLDDLRESTGILVDIETQFMRVEDNFLEDIGVDFRGLGLPGLGPNGFEFNDFGDGSSDFGNVIGRTNDVGAFFSDGGDGNFRARVEDLYDSQLGSDTFRPSGGLSFQWAFLNDLQLELILRAVSKSERIETVTTPRLTVNNGARANLAVLNQIAYVSDFDVQIAQAASIADPIIKVIQDGVILDVRPVVSADRRFITLELRPTIAQLKRPIIEQPTTLGTQNSVTIQLPEVEIQRIRTSIPIPDGSTVLLGGLKESTKQDKRSGVPILNKIPILSFFFERKGTYVANRKLLILLTAHIEIPYEDVPTAAEMGRDL